MRKRYPSESADRVLIRLPDGMKDILAERAKAAHRSMGREALVLIERGLAAEKMAPAPTA